MITIVIQGKIERECYDFYVENYKDHPVIISTWENTIAMLAINNIPKNFTIIENEIPEEKGYQNFFLQLESTIAGLNKVNTEFVIKMRGDEYYSNIPYLLEKVKEFPELIHTSPVFFREWKLYKLHISDHIIVGKTEYVKNMFVGAKNTKLICGTRMSPEQILTIEYLLSRGKNTIVNNKINDKTDKNIMKRYFSILDLENLKDYKITANVIKKIYKNNFDLVKTKSIGDINHI
jgi:hypothetical protein